MAPPPGVGRLDLEAGGIGYVEISSYLRIEERELGCTTAASRALLRSPAVRRVLWIAVLASLISATVAGASASAPWSGRWQRAAGEYGAGSGIFTLAQNGKGVSGKYHWKGCAAVFGGTIAGTANGRSLTATFTHHGDARGTLRLHLSKDGRSITGTFKVTQGTCTGAAGPFHATYVGPLRS